MIAWLARAGDALAFAGLAVGMWRWRQLTADRRALTAFLGLSAGLGAGQAFLKFYGIPTALMGNLWDLAVLTLLIPSLLEVTRGGMRRLLKPVVFVAVVVWAAVFLLDAQLPSFNDLASLGFYALLALSAATVLYQFIEDGGNLWRKDVFVLALACLAAGLFDVVTSVIFLHPKAAIEILRGMMIVRNGVWCGVYALMGYSLTLNRRALRGPVAAKQRVTSQSFFNLKELRP